MKKTLKRPVTVFFVLALICTVAWLAAFALFGLLAKEVNFDFKEFYDRWLDPRVQAFPKLFTGDLYGFVPDGHEQFYLTYVAFGLIGIMVIMMIVGLILVIKRKRARYIPFGLIMLLSTVAVVEIVVMLNVFYIDYFTFKLDGKEVANIAFSYGVIVTAILAYIFSFIEAILGCKYAKQLRKAPVAQEEAPVVEEAPKAEEAPAVEEQPQDVNELFATAPAESEEFVATQPVEERSEDYDTMADFATEPEEQVAQPEEIVVEEVPQQKDAVTKDDLAAILKDVVRDIVRDEIARANAAKAEQEHEHTHRDGDHSITGATFGGPLVVQYFNGGINGQTSPFPPQPPVTQPAPVVVNNAAPAPAPAPVEEPKKEEPAPAPIVVEPAPVVVVPAEEPKEEEEPNKNPIIRIPFTERMLGAEKDMKDNYNELKNEIMSYGVNSRVSNSGDTFRLHRKTYVKITIAGKSLKLYFALDPRDYADSKMPIGDASHHAVYAEIPLIFKVKSGLSLRRAKELIRDVMSKDGLEQGEVESVNWVKELKAAQK